MSALGTIAQVVVIVGAILGAVKTSLEIYDRLASRKRRKKRRKPHAPSKWIRRSRQAALGFSLPA
ncbi:hypothetical protein JQC72_00990 [Polycladomyces sp. WAk]|uniref:Uncharacterized protein n=1 Tax=Polycladomyces zharkentensis TaxID=2807616 RepID=A0ABS2WF85_9BACL|nr:hypothetical protein [Polycladomyces sp. WAk]MBN2908099.1 hypothetical protein [Polycladomyces sp. WAk]